MAAMCAYARLLVDILSMKAVGWALDDDPPRAAAMAMPVPRPPLNSNVVSTTQLRVH